MRLLPLLAMSVGPMLIAAGQTAVAGEWQIQRSVGGSESSQTCTFTQKESELAGTCSTPGGNVPLTGKIDGKTVTWTVKQESSQGGTVTVAYKGTLETDDKMSGTVTAVELHGVEGGFSATKPK